MRHVLTELAARCARRRRVAENVLAKFRASRAGPEVPLETDGGAAGDEASQST